MKAKKLADRIIAAVFILSLLVPLLFTRMTGAEALMRWNDPDCGPQYPSDFIPELEKADLIAYSHGMYFELGRLLGTFGFSVKKIKS